MATPRGYRTKNATPQPLGDVLGRFMRTSGLKDKLRSPAVYNCWPEVAGPDASQHSRVVGFDNATLYVEVDSAPWLHMLSQFRRRELLQGMREMMRGARVTDIRFKIGCGCGDGHNPPPPAETPAERKPCQANPPTTQATSRSYPV